MLELGCASGGNLIPMAETQPDSEFVGVDASERQIKLGQAEISTLGFGNIELKCDNLLNIDESYGTFDYIIAHGVYSWVPDDVQEKILAICNDNLSANGIAYVSYNTYPGWRLRGMIRDLMLYRGSFFGDAGKKLQQGRELLDFLNESTRNQDSAFSKLLSDEVKGLRNKQDYYLIHEHLEDINEPVYFHHFMERAGKSGLQYVGEADYSMMMASNFPDDVATKVTQLASRTMEDGSSEVDVIQLEQYMDFVRNRFFRQTLLCHADQPLIRNASSDVVNNLYASTPAKPEEAISEIDDGARVVFRRPGSTLATTDALLKSAMIEMANRWPASISFNELLSLARARVRDSAMVVDRAMLERESKRLSAPLLHCFATGHIDLSVDAPVFATKISEKPLASKMSRVQAETRESVTNLAHATIKLNDMQRRILKRLDGATTHDELVHKLYQDVQNDDLIVQDKGNDITDPAEIERVLRVMLLECMGQIAESRLLLC